MNCEQFSKFLDEYESLTAIQKAELKEHTKVCEECRLEYEMFMSMLDATRNLPPIKVDDSFLESLNARIDKEVVNAPIHRNAWEHIKLNAHRYSAAAACVALIAAIGVNSTDFVDKLINPYGEQDLVPVVTEAPSDEDVVAGIAITSTVEPKEAEETSAPAKGTPEAVDSTDSPVATAKPSVTAKPASKPTSTPVVVISQDPVATKAPVEDGQVNTPAVASAGEIGEPYTMQPGGYELPQTQKPESRSTDVANAYSLDNTPNYLKVAKEDMERVKNLITQYSEDSNGDIYLMSKESIEKILAILSKEGIEYDNALVTAADGSVAFKLIIS